MSEGRTWTTNTCGGSGVHGGVVLGHKRRLEERRDWELYNGT